MHNALESRLPEHAESTIVLAIQHANAGGLPFAALIINAQGEVIGEGVNQVAQQLDCTAHAEVQAIRNASRNTRRVALHGATLIASGEPCALCFMAIHMAGIKNVICLSSRHDAADHGFDYRWTYRHINTSLLNALNVVMLENDRKLLPFQVATQQLRNSN